MPFTKKSEDQSGVSSWLIWGLSPMYYMSCHIQEKTLIILRRMRWSYPRNRDTLVLESCGEVNALLDLEIQPSWIPFHEFDIHSASSWNQKEMDANTTSSCYSKARHDSLETVPVASSGCHHQVQIWADLFSQTCYLFFTQCSIPITVLRRVIAPCTQMQSLLSSWANWVASLCPKLSLPGWNPN